MGVNMVGFCITDNDVCEYASKQEIIRRYYIAQCDARVGIIPKDVVNKIELLMRRLNLSIYDRKVVEPALKKAQVTGAASVAIELNEGRIMNISLLYLQLEVF